MSPMELTVDAIRSSFRSKGMRMGRHTRSAHSMDDSNNDRPSRKISADAVMRKASFANAKMAKHRQQSESRGSNGGSEDMDSSRSRENLQREGSSFGDEPSCSDGGGEDTGGSRRARSTTSTRISLFFGKKMEMLNALKTLKETSASRAPDFLQLEEHWNTIVKNFEQLPLRAKHQQEAIWEIAVTERNYIEHLRHMDDLQRYLNDLRQRGFLPEIEPYKVFCNYSDLYRCNVNFWRSAVLPMLDKSRATGCPLDPLELWPGFENIAGWSEFYVRLHVEHNREYVQRAVKENTLFKEFVEWAEAQETMKRLKFVETISTYPMQHMTRYGLLLSAILKYSTDAEERVTLQRMIDEANAATHRLNFELDNKDLRTKLSSIMMSIEGCDYLDGDEVEKVWGNRPPINLIALMPMTCHHRRVLLKGDVKVKEGRTATKIDMTCFVFTDMFLMCRASKKADRLRIARPPMHINKIVIYPAEPATGFYVMYMNEFGPNNLFLLTTPCTDDTKRWIEMIQMAKDDFALAMHPDDIRRAGATRLFLDGSGSTCSLGPSSSAGMLPMAPYPPLHTMIAHRKSNSMDSQAVAAAGHQHISELRKAAVICSTEQLDRQGNHSEARLPPRGGHKLSVASCVAAPISTSKSSIDLHLAVRPRNNSPETHGRSRSNSSGPEIGDASSCLEMQAEDGQRSRSPSPTIRRHTVELNGRGTPGGGGSPLVCTPQGGRGTPLDSLRGTPRSESPATASPDTELSASPALLITSTEEEGSAGVRENGGASTPNSGRRFEKRYHTSDGIDVPKKGSIPGGILKRFSWNVSTAVGSTRGKINRLNEQSRRSSQSSTAASSESFASSTSGISSSSSHIEATIDEIGPYNASSSHVSTISVNESPLPVSNCAMRSSSQSTLSISLDDDGTTIKEKEQAGQSPPLSSSSTSSNGSSPPPPLPDLPPPPAVCAAQAAAIHCKSAELLKFIMDNHLETSDV